MTTGQLIKVARKSAGLTQKELGEKLGIAYQTLAQWENDLRNPKIETLNRIAAALQVDPYSLYSFDQACESMVERINTRERVNAALDKLNDAGMEKAADIVWIIAEVPRYRAETAPQSPPAKDTTPATDGPETPPEGE